MAWLIYGHRYAPSMISLLTLQAWLLVTASIALKIFINLSLGTHLHLSPHTQTATRPSKNLPSRPFRQPANSRSSLPSLSLGARMAARVKLRPLKGGTEFSLSDLLNRLDNNPSDPYALREFEEIFDNVSEDEGFRFASMSVQSRQDRHLRRFVAVMRLKNHRYSFSNVCLLCIGNDASQGMPRSKVYQMKRSSNARSKMRQKSKLSRI